ncbi:MAG: RecQ family ATP-dependent DNA helicase [Saprospiraceae bacterium]
MSTALEALKKYWGYQEFRHPQEEIIHAVVDTKDVIALLPTGGGKSLCFQLPTMIGRYQKAIVVSPLISLMEDQVENLRKHHIKAIAIHSGLTSNQIDYQIDNFIYGDFNFLYISPERILSNDFQARLGKMKLDLIAVDEAHCISQWGFDFRPSYLSIHTIREFHPNVPMIALTATASERVINDISQYLNMKDPEIFKKSFFRDNLQFFVINTDNKQHEILYLLSKLGTNGIIYTRNRRNTVQIKEWLAKHGIKSISYHAGMKTSERNLAQKNWKDGKIPLAIATNAFGMGIDKDDVRFVFHIDVASSPEEYYQEAGRAGRDGKKAFAITLISDVDIENSKSQLEKQFPSYEAIKKAYISLCHFYKIAIGSGFLESFTFHIDEFSDYSKLDYSSLNFILKILEKDGWISLSEGIRMPSTVQIIASKEEIYNIPHEEAIYDELLKSLLRNYEGIWSFPTKIDEERIGKILGISKEKTEDLLLILTRDGIVNYIPSLSDNTITFIRERPINENFSIEKHRYEASKSMARNRLNAMIDYLQKEECRQSMILQYFGEKPIKCGMCDICLGSHKVILSKEDQTIVKKQLNTLRSETKIDVFTRNWPYNKRKAVTHFLKTLVDNEEIAISGNAILPSKNGSL